MGAWGYGPLDNDSAADFLGDTVQPVVYIVERVLMAVDAGTANDDVVRATAWLYERIGLPYVYEAGKIDDHRGRLIAALEAMVAAAEIGDNPDTSDPDYIASIQAQIDTLTNMA